MSDLFQADVPDQYVEDVARVMVEANWHTYQVLTKRSDRLQHLLSSRLRFAAEQPHIWWGVSVEDRKYGLPRIERLRATPAHTRFLSIEPLLEDLGNLDLSRMDWVIVGGESGIGARPMAAAWVEHVLESCKNQGVLFFFKQWGGVRKSRAGRLLNGRTFDEMPMRIATAMPTRSARMAAIERWTLKTTSKQHDPLVMSTIVA